jgi:hypothetical protein
MRAKIKDVREMVPSDWDVKKTRGGFLLMDMEGQVFVVVNDAIEEVQAQVDRIFVPDGE